MNLPNLLTLLRIALVPVLILTFLLPGYWSYVLGAGIFALAGITDWLDGYLARKWEQMSQFGAFLDPVADKLIVVSALVMLAGTHANVWFSLAAVVIVGREVAISALREWMAEMQRRGLVAVTWVGKAKTAVQMVAILVLLAHPPNFELPLVMLGYALLVVAAVLTLWSMAVYLRAAWPTLREAYRDSASS